MKNNKNINLTDRQTDIDILKGILIVLVVYGHAFVSQNHYELDIPGNWIYLFHMPAFFMIGGMLHYPAKKENIRKKVIARAKRILVPYGLYLMLGVGIFFLRIISDNMEFVDIFKLFCKLIYGGRYLNVFFIGPCWFLTAYFVTTILVSFITLIEQKSYRFFIYFACWCFGHVWAWLLSECYLPWSIEIGIFAVAYYGLGYEAKNYLRRKSCRLVGCSIVVLFTLLYFFTDLSYVRGFGIEMWCHYNRDLVLDLVIPLAFFELLLSISIILDRHFINVKKMLVELGKYTVPIMALHILVFRIVAKIIDVRIPWLITILGVLFPYLIAKYIYPILFREKKKFLL